MTTKEKITQKIQVKTPLTNEQKDELLKEISDADALITKVNEELDAHKDSVKEIVKEQGAKISSSIAIYRKGYTEKTVECFVEYNGNTPTFTDVKTGEIIESKLIINNQQLSLNQHQIDADKFIDAINKLEDENNNGDEN